HNALVRIAKDNRATLDQLKQMVQEQGVNFAEYRENIRHQIIISKLHQQIVGDSITVSPQEVKKFLKNYPAENVSYQYHIKDYVVNLPEDAPESAVKAAQREAAKLVARLQKGEDDSAITQDESISLNDLGLRDLEAIPDIFVKTVKNMKVDGYSKPIIAANGV